MNIVVYLPPNFYSAIASSIAETLQAVNEIHGSNIFVTSFVSKNKAVSRSGIIFPAKKQFLGKIDVLIILSGISLETKYIAAIIEKESRFAGFLVSQAVEHGAIIAGTCGASLLLAHLGMLNGKRATVAWWVKKEAMRLYPKVKWDSSRMVIYEDGIYTSGAVYAGIDLLSVLLVDLGFGKEEKQVSQLMAIPSIREFQTPYEMIIAEINPPPFEEKLNKIIQETGLVKLTIEVICSNLAMSYRTLSRKFISELFISPGKWLQHQRLEAAKLLLKETQWSIGEICYQVGYLDLPSFSRLFLKKTGLTPNEFRRQAPR